MTYLVLIILISNEWYTELQLNKANSFDTETPFWDLDFPFLDGDVTDSPSYVVYISQLIRFAIVRSNVSDFNIRNPFLTAKLLKQGYRYHKIRKAFSKFYHRHSELIVKNNIGLKPLCNKANGIQYLM